MDKFTALIGATAAFAAMLLASPEARADDELPPPCQFEDGNRDGLPCLWLDDDTGEVWYVDSTNYR